MIITVREDARAVSSAALPSGPMLHRSHTTLGGNDHTTQLWTEPTGLNCIRGWASFPRPRRTALRRLQLNLYVKVDIHDQRRSNLAYLAGTALYHTRPAPISSNPDGLRISARITSRWRAGTTEACSTSSEPAEARSLEGAAVCQGCPAHRVHRCSSGTWSLPDHAAFWTCDLAPSMLLHSRPAITPRTSSCTRIICVCGCCPPTIVSLQ